MNWEPDHIRDGRFGQFLANNVDWALSRERFWGTPLPIWINDQTGKRMAVASAQEILELNPNAFDRFKEAKRADPDLSEHLMVHKPWIDEVTWQVEGEAGVYRRVPEVIDCWFDSGCMPFAQWGYPHQNQDEFKAQFPADFISEAVDQTRGWFYSLIMISTLLHDTETPHPFRNCFVMGLITDEKGKKLSKRDKNYTDPLELIDKLGADAVRWSFYSATVPGQSTRFFDRGPSDAARGFLLKIWNVYSFFVTYANIDGWTPGPDDGSDDGELSDLDRWILAELDHTVTRVRAELDVFKSHIATRHLQSFVDALSNWYVRRSRARFWGADDTADKRAAFSTLHRVLVELSQLAAPFVPFVTEVIYRNLTKTDASVHLSDFPIPIENREDTPLREAVSMARAIVSAGSRVRNTQKLKVRQPLQRAIVVAQDDERRAVERFADSVREELNVLVLDFTKEPGQYVEVEVLPNFRLLGKRMGKEMPACKQALAAADGAALQQELEAKGQITVTLPSGPTTLTTEEVQIRYRAKEGFAAAAEAGRVVILETQITDELRRAGFAREAKFHIQQARKEMELAFERRIAVTWQADGDLAMAIEEHQQTLAEETLATRFERTSTAGDGRTFDANVDGADLKLWIQELG